MPGIVPLVVADPLGRTYEEMAANPAMKALMDRMDKVRMKEGDMEGKHPAVSYRKVV